ncbi:MAG: hypothetical protein K0Q59_2826 [Paenibacillus sp.]|nr:hypothetical protein [Paenibacillus sp.]
MQEERYQKINELLVKSNSVKVSELVQFLNVSVDTVRRDLENMEKNGLLKRVHGGAVPLPDHGNKQSFPQRQSKYQAEKAELAELASGLVSEGQAVAMNAGTTNVEVAKKLAERFERLTIITNGLQIVEPFAHKKGFVVIVPGGIVDYEEHALYGANCEEQIASYNIDVAFIACNAISLQKGLTDFRINEVGIIRKMLDCSRYNVVVADSSKFETTSYLNVAPLNRIDRIVTDSHVSMSVVEKYAGQQTIIVYPEVME